MDGEEYSVAVEHRSERRFFPLGVNDPGLALSRAGEIEAVVRKQGWTAARETYPVEFTVALFWTLSPLTCTYTTLYSLPGAVPERWRQYLNPQAGNCRTLVIQPEVEIRRALEFWVNCQPGFACAAGCASMEEARAVGRRGRAELVLVDRAYLETAGGPTLEKLSEAFAPAKVFRFGIFGESNYIFHSVTGVKTGYLLCRRTPRRLFEPIHSLSENKDLSEGLLRRKVQAYFQALFAEELEGGNEAGTARLTSREQEVLKALARGLSEKEVAATLNISAQTVHNHVKNIYGKLDAHSRTEAVMKYLKRTPLP